MGRGADEMGMIDRGEVILPVSRNALLRRNNTKSRNTIMKGLSRVENQLIRIYLRRFYVRTYGLFKQSYHCSIIAVRF